MNFSLFARRLISLSALRSAHNVVPSPVLTLPAFAAARRTFFTTHRIELPAAAPKTASTVGAKKTKRKPAAKKAAPKKVKAKPKPKAKKKAETPAALKRVPKADRPPTRPPNAYILYFSKLFQTQPRKAKSMEDAHTTSKQASAAWKNFTLAEKQPYYDEVEVLKKQHEKDVQEYWKNAPLDVVKRLNARRKADGKNLIRRPHQEGDTVRPMVPFFRFIQSFRKSPDGRAIQELGTTGEGRAAANIAREAGKRWRAMSDSEKAPYVDAYQKESVDYKSKSATASASL